MEPCDDVTCCPACGHRIFTVSVLAKNKYCLQLYEDGSSELELTSIDIEEDENAILQCRRCGTIISRDVIEFVQPDEDGRVDEWTRIRSARDMDDEVELSEW